jgi:DNA repair protein RadA/Sms
VPAEVQNLKKFKGKSFKRMSCGISEVDRVLGGGIVSGEVILLSGEPGIGKSTLLSQICLKLSEKQDVLYVSGEESLEQISQRFNRLSSGGRPSGKGGQSDDKRGEGSSESSDESSGRDDSDGPKALSNGADFSDLNITEETDVDKIVALVKKSKPDLVIVDSIQALSSQDSRSFPGSMSQVRNCGSKLTRIAKSMKIPIIVVGQVTKEGVVAGPKVLEHIVDAVLYFEGDEVGFYRILRGIKNRFGPTDEVGLFEMTSKGLRQLKDPGRAFCDIGDDIQPGVALSAVYKGSRVLFVEIQALTSQAVFASPRRVTTGFSKSRLQMLCAVLSRRGGVNLGNDDVFVNVMGGLRLDDPSVDLAVCMAIISAKKDKALKAESVYVGEVGLSGLVYPVFFSDRIKSEASRRKLNVLGAVGSGKEKSKSLRSFVKKL